MRKWIAAVIAMFSVAVLAPAPAQAGTTNLNAAIAIVSVVVDCGVAGDGNGWGAVFHAYTNFDGGTMGVSGGNFPHWWSPQSTISSDSYFRSNHYISASKASVTVSVQLRITRTVWPPATVYRSAQITAHRPGC